MRALIATLLLLSCRREEVTFPVEPPSLYDRHRAESTTPTAQDLRTISEPFAINCGTVSDRKSADLVYTCAANAIEARHPFFCRYAPIALPEVASGTDVSPVSIGGVWALPAAFIGNSRGQVFSAFRSHAGQLTVREILPDRPRRLGAGMTPPSPLNSSTLKISASGAAGISGLVIIEAVIRADGTAADTVILKPLPMGIDRMAEQLVRDTKFTPSRFFGVPVPVVYNVSVSVNHGLIQLASTRPN